MTRNEMPLDVIWPRLIAIADEMATTMLRTAFSHDVVRSTTCRPGYLILVVIYWRKLG